LLAGQSAGRAGPTRGPLLSGGVALRGSGITIGGSVTAITCGSLAVGASDLPGGEVGLRVREPVADGRLHVALRRGIVAPGGPPVSLLRHGASLRRCGDPAEDGAPGGVVQRAVPLPRSRAKHYIGRDGESTIRRQARLRSRPPRRGRNRHECGVSDPRPIELDGLPYGRASGPLLTMRVMPKSSNRGKRNARRRAVLEAEQHTGPDSSLILHRFPDGWTIRRLMTPMDELREGLLSHNCLWMFDGRQYWDWPGTICSLRDPDNYPHVTFRFARPEIRHAPDDREGWVDNAGGHGDSKPIKPEYERRLLEWIRTLPHPTEVDGSNGAFSDARVLKMAAGGPSARQRQLLERAAVQAAV
jgi:hypothetical protein